MNYKFILLMFIMLSVILTSTYATTDTIGDCTAPDSAGVIRTFYQSITASNNGKVQTIGVNMVDGSGQVTTAIFSNGIDQASNNQVPINLLGNSILTTISASGWQDLSIPQTVTITSGHVYFLAFQVTAGKTYCAGANSNYNFISNIHALGDWSSNDIAGGTFAETYNVRMIYTSTTTTTTTTTSTTSTTSTTTATTTTTPPATNQTSLGDVAVSGFNVVPIFAYILMLLGGGIAFITSKRVAIGFFSATMTGIAIILLGAALTPPATIINAGVVAVCGTLFIATAWFEVHTRSK